MSAMHEATIQKFLALADRLSADGARILEAGSPDELHLTAIALILVVLTAWLVKKKHGSVVQSFLARNKPANILASDRFFENKRSIKLKPCPNCAEQLLISALVCDACDYNFLAARPLRGQQLLPPPQPHA